MAVIRPFRALRPTPDVAAKVASVPYDVISVSEARALADGNPLSYLHVIRPEIDLPENTDEHDESVYAKGAENLHRYADGPHSVIEKTPAVYVYRLRMGNREQTGLYGLVSVEEYRRGAILKHENTRPPKVQDRTRHILAQRAHAEPVSLVFRDHGAVMDTMSTAKMLPPIYDFTADDGVQHTFWRAPDAANVSTAFSEISALYVADGHHRCQASSQAWLDTKWPSSAFFPAVCFPVSAVHIMPYNRIVRVPPDVDLLGQVQERCSIRRASGQTQPTRRGDVCMYAEGDWHTVTLPETHRPTVADTLDVARLSEFVLEPVLGILDQRTDPNIMFVGGIRGEDELVRRVDEGGHMAAFSMYPTSVEELLDVSDAGLLMPPKSTWFEPKLRSGLLVHLFD